MRRDANLWAYVFLTLLGLIALVNRFDPPVPAGQGCRVGYVYDGDSVELICDDRRETARVLGIDTPELQGKCPSEIVTAEAAKKALAAMVRQADVVSVEIKGRDKYHRPLIRLLLDDGDAAELMIAAGHGRPYDGGHRDGWCH